MSELTRPVDVSTESDGMLKVTVSGVPSSTDLVVALRLKDVIVASSQGFVIVKAMLVAGMLNVVEDWPTLVTVIIELIEFVYGVALALLTSAVSTWKEGVK